MPRYYSTIPYAWRKVAAASALAALATVGGLSACSKPRQEAASDAVSGAAADVSAGVSSVAADMDAQKTQDFVTKAAIGSLFEVETSKLAKATSKSKAVLAFASQMVADHGRAGAALNTAAGKTSGLTPPVALDDEHQKKLDDLKGKTGKDFDDAYIDAQKSAHDDAVDLFDDYAKNGKDTALQAFAAETLPTLKMHQDKAKNLEP